jgi:NAD(P)-dependent dehydrogenase (short-subunit alcohol dehydrogenase family)
MRLADKIVLVAGSGKGTGREIALQAAREGADVITSARTQRDAEAVAGEIRALGRRSIGLAADLSIGEQAGQLVQRALEEFGRVDVLIYNAALERQRRFIKISEAEWDQMLDTNLKGYFVCSQALARHWVAEKQPGAIVAIASTAGIVGFPNNADYCASKGGMIALTKAMALDLGNFGIRANAVAPGFIQSEAVEEQRTNEAASRALDAIQRYIPAQRFAARSEVASAALFLASDEAGYTNGAVLQVDGGITLGALPAPN